MRDPTRAIALPALAIILVVLVSPWSGPRPAEALQVPLTLTQLTALADRVVAGQVLITYAQRDNNGRGIRTHVIINVRDHIKGKPNTATLDVAVPGGRVDDLTMHVSEAPEFSRDEAVVVFLKQNDDGTYDVVGWEQGKFEVANGEVRNRASGFRARALDFAHEVNRILAALDASQPAAAEIAQSVAAWADAMVPARTGVRAQTFVSNNARWPAGTLTYLVNPANGDLDAAATLNSLQAAASTWTSVSTASFKFVYGGATNATSIDGSAPNGQNEIIFVTQSPNGSLATTTWWTSGTNPDGTAKIIETDLVFNDAYLWSAAPSGSQFDLQSVATHELGHMLSLGHDADPNAVMYYAIPAATIKRALYTTDIEGINALYPGASSLPASTPTPTKVPPTATRTPLPPTPTPTATPTLPAYCKADVNRDRVITMADVNAIAAAWHSVDPADLRKYDVNGDGRITGEDVAIASGYLNAPC